MKQAGAVKIGQQCPRCRKRVRDEQSARKLAMFLRSNVVRLSRARLGYTRTHAYECPHGNGWHVGRAGKREL